MLNYATTIGLAFAACAVACGQGGMEGDSQAGDAAQTAAPDDLPAGFVHVPNGVIAHTDCIHEIPNGAVVDRNNDVTLDGKFIAHFEECSYPIRLSPRREAVTAPAPLGGLPSSAGGWIESAWAYAPYGTEFVSSSSTFTVPEPPATHLDTAQRGAGQVVYLFPSIESSNAIVQPVLQWGVSAAGQVLSGVFGGPSTSGSIGSTSSWTYAAWGLMNSTSSNQPAYVYHSTGMTVNPGDTLTGSMKMVSQPTGANGSASWEVVATDNTLNTSQTALFWVQSTGSSWNTAQTGVLEAYWVNSCNDLPTGYTFFQYPTLQEVSYPLTSSSTWITNAPSAAAWSVLSYDGKSGGKLLTSGYEGPSCGFAEALGTTSQGTSLTY